MLITSKISLEFTYDVIEIGPSQLIIPDSDMKVGCVFHNATISLKNEDFSFLVKTK